MTKPFIAPLAKDDIQDPELKELLAEAEKLGVPDEMLIRIIARVPKMAAVTLRMLIRSHADGNVDHKLKEVVRIHLARFVGDPYFSTLRSKRALAAGLSEEKIEAGCGDYEDSDLLTEAEKSALRYAEQMFLDSSKVDKEIYDDLKKHYTEPQIMELGSFIAFHYGMQRAARALGAMPKGA